MHALRNTLVCSALDALKIVAHIQSNGGDTCTGLAVVCCCSHKSGCVELGISTAVRYKLQVVYMLLVCEGGGRAEWKHCSHLLSFED